VGFQNITPVHVTMLSRKLFIPAVLAAMLVVLVGCKPDPETPLPLPETPASDSGGAPQPAAAAPDDMDEPAVNDAGEAAQRDAHTAEQDDNVEAAMQGSLKNDDRPVSDTAADAAQAATAAAAEAVQKAGLAADRASSAADEVSDQAADEVAAAAERARAALKASHSEARESVADTASRASDAVSSAGVEVSGEARIDAPIRSGETKSTGEPDPASAGQPD